MIYFPPIAHIVLIASYSVGLISSNFLHFILHSDADISVADYFEYTRKFTERLDEIGEDYLEQDRKRRKRTGKRKQAPSTLNTDHLPDNTENIHLAEVAMAARASKEFMEPNDLESPDDEQTSEQMREC